MASEETVVRVIGSQLQAHMGKQVLLVGKGIQAGNMSLKMESCDGQVVDVQLLQQPDGNVACPMEVIGTVMGPRSVKAQELSLYPDWEGVFDMETYSSILETIHSDRALEEYVLGMH